VSKSLLFGLLSGIEDGGAMFLQNSEVFPKCKELSFKRLQCLHGIVSHVHKKLRGFIPRVNYIDRVTAKLVPTFADIGYRVVSAIDPHDRILGF
jgi:hypothetical protein